MSAAVPPEVRELRQQLHKKRVRAEHAKALANGPVFDPRTLDRSKYLPHQSDRERNRATRYQSA